MRNRETTVLRRPPRTGPRSFLAAGVSFRGFFVPGLLAVALAGALLGVPTARAATSPWAENEQSRVRLVTPWEAAPAGGTLTAGLEFETEPGWHVYWKNSGDAGYPPAVDLAATPEVAAAELLWPVPERYELPGDLVAFGYEGRVVYPLVLELGPTAGPASGPLHLAAEVDYLVCEVDCIPYTYVLELEQPWAEDGAAGVPDASTAALLESWNARVPRLVDPVAGVSTDGVLDLSDPESPALLVRFGGLEAADETTDPELFLEASDTFEMERPERLEAAGGELRFRVPLAFRARPDDLPTEAVFAWTLAGAATADGAAAPVEARRTVSVRTAAATGLAGEGENGAVAEDGAAAGLALLLAWAFSGGLLLHLAPGVLPLTAVRLAELGGGEGGPSAERAGVRRGALLTAGGAFLGCLALLPLAAVARATGRGGTWGSQLQDPVPVTLLALVSLLVALNLWGFLRHPLQPATGGDGSVRRKLPGAGSAVLAGLAMAVLGLGWNLPPLARSLGPAFATGSALRLSAVLAVSALGLGLALPFLVTALRPAWAAAYAGRLAPTAQARGRLAEAFAFVELGAALWFLYLLSRQVSGEGLAFIQLTLLGVALAAWWRSAAVRRSARAAAFVLLAILAAATVWLAGSYRLAGGEARTGPPEAPSATTSVEARRTAASPAEATPTQAAAEERG